MKKRGLGKVKDNRKWTEKILELRKIGEEPPFNKAGFWQEYELPEIKIQKEPEK